MENILVIGASGNIGREILSHFAPSQQQCIWTTTRLKDIAEFATGIRYFDFENIAGSVKSFSAVDTVFLLRPPALSDVKKYFAPVIVACLEFKVKHIVFLSVQGADQSFIIPHAKIERLIVRSGIPYTFVRPSYFMQNLTTTLLDDIRKKNEIFLPAGKARFLWVDAADIGKAVARILENVSMHFKATYTITGTELFNFSEVAFKMAAIVGRKIQYRSASPFSFYFRKRHDNMATGMIIVMILLHMLPRLQSAPKSSLDFTVLTKERATSLDVFLKRNKSLF